MNYTGSDWISRRFSPASILNVELLNTALSPSEELPSHFPSLYWSWDSPMLARNVSLKPNENEGHKTEQELAWMEENAGALLTQGW